MIRKQVFRIEPTHIRLVGVGGSLFVKKAYTNLYHIQTSKVMFAVQIWLRERKQSTVLAEE